MVEIVNRGASQSFNDRVAAVWVQTPAAVDRLARRTGWHGETLAIYATHPCGLAFVDQNERTINYVERTGLPGLPFIKIRSKKSTSLYTHFHEIGHFLDIELGGGQRLSDEDAFIQACETDRQTKDIDARATQELYRRPFLHNPLRNRRELLADLVAQNALQITSEIAGAMPVAARYMGQRVKPLGLAS